ncbi:helix-turn-helix transcriptional regulator [Spirochaeta isovalerica]|uniref:AraC-like DNA-binding protein n=1 Tax=Spirochaeta isovalerica TaxID=150 RepID=A0A841RB55_9SPIO|nr:AraC family transcriptional regulator [Spirochaeta isovalerica]MBB6479652.1 AraC-like DNA-binding protein [Spirochaeta isovalerica]
MIHSGPVICQIYHDSYHHVSTPEEGRLLFFFQLEGSASVHLGGTVLDVQDSCAFIMPSALSFRVRGRGRARLLDCRISYINSLLKSSIGSALSSLLPSVKTGPFRAYCLSGHSVLRLEPLLDIISEETGLKRSDYLDMIHFQIFEILILLRREGALSQADIETWSVSQRVWQIEDVAEFIDSNYDIPFTLEELAVRCNLNPSYFSRAFREKMGLPLFEYINRMRIGRAVQLLKNTNLAILEIAMTVGYNNVSFFNRYFRKLKGCSPGEFRKKILE